MPARVGATQRRALLIATAIFALAALVGPSAQDKVADQDQEQEQARQLDALINQLGNYLLQYEDELGTVVASEEYQQQELRVPRRAARLNLPSAGDVVRDRKLESDIAFLRLPGAGTWLGVRDVLKVNGRNVARNDERLSALLKQLQHKDVFDEAARIVAASAAFNLGGMRTINVPTLPLEVLHPDHHVQFIFKLRGPDKVDGRQTMRLDFEEFDVPTIINNPDGNPLFIRGTAWVEPGSGRLWRADLHVRPKTEARGSQTFQTGLRVDFMLNDSLGLLVPKEMVEDFYVIGGRGVGRAKYSNFRRFSTAGRAVPQ
jgi:hypothetical protein